MKAAGREENTMSNRGFRLPDRLDEINCWRGAGQRPKDTNSEEKMHAMLKSFLSCRFWIFAGAAALVPFRP